MRKNNVRINSHLEVSPSVSGGPLLYLMTSDETPDDGITWTAALLNADQVDNLIEVLQTMRASWNDQ